MHRGMYRYVLGIDPDIEKSGFALLDVEKRTFVSVNSFRFPEAVSFLSTIDKENLLVVIEDSAATTNNWHLTRYDSTRTAARKGHDVGLCHATARHLQEMAETYKLKAMSVFPLRKIWGKDGGEKISHKELSDFVSDMPKRTNQEERDAMLLAWSHAELPIFVKPKPYK